MAYIQADVDVMNMALRRVGSEAIVLTDANSPTSKPAKVVVSYYDNTVKEVLRIIPWNSAIARASVTGTSDSTTAYSRVFSLSAIMPFPYWVTGVAYSVGQVVVNAAGTKQYVCVVAGTSTTEPIGTSTSAVETAGTGWFYLGAPATNLLIRTLDINGDDSIPYKIEGTNLFCNEASPIKLRFIKKLIPPFSDSVLCEAIVSRLASKLCYAITADPQVSTALYQEFTMNLALGKQLCVSEDRADVVDIMSLYAQSIPLAMKANKVEG